MISNKVSRRIGLTGLVSVFLGAAWIINAEPARDRILSDASLYLAEENVLLEISLSYPFRYLSHFPQEKGCELRIRLQPVRVPASDAGAVFRREAMRPADAGVAAIDEVVYEGDAIGGPQITIHFTRPVRYQVIPGSDYRRVTVAILELGQKNQPSN